MRNIARDHDAPAFYVYPKFTKELAICTLRLIPAGVQKLHLHGLPRRPLLSLNPRRLIDSLGFLIFQLRGSSPFYQIHTDSRDAKAMLLFRPAGWLEFYRRVARLLELNPAVLGLFGSSWFFDPALARVSPELAYLSRLVTDHGGRLICRGPCGQGSREDALSLSARRRELFAAGEYVPMDYLAVWPRRELIAAAGGESSPPEKSSKALSSASRW